MNASVRFLVVPKVAHPWADEVRAGAIEQARLLGHAGVRIEVDYQTPVNSQLRAQEEILVAAAKTPPAGIAIDPVEAPANMESLRRLQDMGVAVVLFDSPTAHSGLCSVGNDFIEQGRLAAERLVLEINGTGKVAIMKGVPTAPNHLQRYEAQCAVLRQYAGVTIVDGGADQDDILLAEQEADRTLSAHPDLRGYLCCDASGPVGIAAALRKRNLAGQVAAVTMDGIGPILDAIRDGVIRASAATRPRLQGGLAVHMLWLASQGVALPKQIDTGIDMITPENVSSFLALRSNGG